MLRLRLRLRLILRLRLRLILILILILTLILILILIPIPILILILYYTILYYFLLWHVLYYFPLGSIVLRCVTLALSLCTPSRSGRSMHGACERRESCRCCAMSCYDTGVCEKTLLLHEPLPCNPTAEAALQPLIWCSASFNSSVSCSPEDCFFHRHRYDISWYAMSDCTILYIHYWHYCLLWYIGSCRITLASSPCPSSRSSSSTFSTWTARAGSSVRPCCSRATRARPAANALTIVLLLY